MKILSEDSAGQQIIESTEKNGLAGFAALMDDVAVLPENEREKIACFAQGVIAASYGRKADDSNG